MLSAINILSLLTQRANSIRFKTMWFWLLLPCFTLIRNVEGDTKRLVVCEQHIVSISCPDSISIQSAMWGRLDKTTCSSNYMSGAPELQTTFCSLGSMLSMSKSICDGKTDCLLIVTWQSLGDPCQNIYKYLDISVSCQGNVSLTAAMIPAPITTTTSQQLVRTNQNSPPMPPAVYSSKAPNPIAQPVATVGQDTNHQVGQQSTQAAIPAKATANNNAGQSVFQKNSWLMWILIGTALVSVVAFCCCWRVCCCGAAKRREDKKKNKEKRKEKSEENKHPSRSVAPEISIGPPKKI